MTSIQSIKEAKRGDVITATTETFKNGRTFSFTVGSNFESEILLVGNNGRTRKTFSHKELNIKSITRF